MSTTTAYDDVTTAVQSGLGGYVSWILSNITTSTTNNNSVQLLSDKTIAKTLDASIPDYMAAIPAGSEFVSLNVKFKAYVDAVYGGVTYTFKLRQNGVDTYSTSLNDTNTANKTYSGDKTFFGLTGTVQQIILDLQSGAITFRFNAYSAGSNRLFTLNDFQVQLVYAAPDTRRASIISGLA